MAAGAPRDVAGGDEDSGVAGVEKAKGGPDAGGAPHLPTPLSAGALSNGFFEGQKDGDAVAGVEQAVGS